MCLNWYSLAKESSQRLVYHNVYCEECGTLIKTYYVDNDLLSIPEPIRKMVHTFKCNKCKGIKPGGFGNESLNFNRIDPYESGSSWDNLVKVYEDL